MFNVAEASYLVGATSKKAIKNTFLSVIRLTFNRAPKPRFFCLTTYKNDENVKINLPLPKKNKKGKTRHSSTVKMNSSKKSINGLLEWLTKAILASNPGVTKEEKWVSETAINQALDQGNLSLIHI